MSNVIIQKINLYDLELQGNSSSDEEEENIAKNQQKQPSVAAYLTKKSPKQQNTENGGDKLIECEISDNLDAARAVKSPEIVKNSRKPQKTANSSQTATNGHKSTQNDSNKSSNSTDTATESAQHENPSTDPQTSSELNPQIVIKEEVVEIDDNPVIQQTWQDLDQHTFIKQENELMVPPDSLDGENIMEDEIEEQDLRTFASQNQHPEDVQLTASQDPEEVAEDSELFKPNGELGMLDDKFGFFYKGSENSHKTIDQHDEDIMTSQDIPVDFDDNLMEFEGNPAKRMRIDAAENVTKSQEVHQNVTKVYTHTIVKSLPKDIIVRRTSGRQVACKSTSSVATQLTSPDKPADAENLATSKKVIAKIGENLTKIGETFVKFGKNVDKNSNNSERLLPTLSDEYIVTSIKEEPVDDDQMDQDYTEEFIVTENEPEKLVTNSELAKSFTKNIGIVNKFGEMSSQIVGNIIGRRGEAAQNAAKLGQNAVKIGVSPKKFGLDPSKVGGNFVKVGQSLKIGQPSTGSPIASRASLAASKGSPASTRVTPAPSKVIISTKVIQNPAKIPQTSSATPQRLSMPSTSYFMPKQFLDMQIKEEKLDDDGTAVESTALDTSQDPSDPANFLETRIKEEDPDEYFTSAYNQNITSKPLNSTVTSTNETIVSTKIVTLPASNLLKSRKIIVIKKPMTPGTKQLSGHSIQRALKSQMRSSPGSSNTPVNNVESTRYIIKTVAMPNKTIKIENNPKSSLQISSVSSAVNQGPSTSFKTITYPKSDTNSTVVKQSDAIYRCHKCHLLFSSHSEYTEHLSEHRIPQGIVFNEKRVIKLEELQKMNAYQCAQCSAGFPTLEKLSAHENRHKTEFACKYCGKTFLQMYRYKEHLLQHEKKKEKYLECSHCDKKFLKQIRLDEHVMAAHAIKDAYICAYCDSKYATNAMLQEHQRTAHTKKTAMKCGLCNYETYVKQNFEKHASMHMRYVEKLNSNQFFKCDQCPQSFREKGVLEMHKQHMHS
ncbi:uncharacterized protein [Chironomus tepperi]|uniref:uncharacterized protein n=1 Tax=Chironomus tepperi TaxID=113505 RepID=UPI00391F0511